MTGSDAQVRGLLPTAVESDSLSGPPASYGASEMARSFLAGTPSKMDDLAENAAAITTNADTPPRGKNTQYLIPDAARARQYEAKFLSACRKYE